MLLRAVVIDVRVVGSPFNKTQIVQFEINGEAKSVDVPAKEVRIDRSDSILVAQEGDEFAFVAKANDFSPFIRA